MVPALTLLACALSVLPGPATGEPALRDPQTPAELATAAERTGYEHTTRHEEVLTLMDRIAAGSAVARRASMGRTVENRDIPLLILSDPPVQSAAEAHRLVRDESRLVVLLFANIHAGECDGKEALLMLARELAAGGSPLLRELIIVIAPNFNADGNERVGPDNRPGQVGPKEMGVRENAMGLDLNRDFVKLETPEVRALVRFMNEWDPAVLVDAHTTNGSLHRYLITHEGPKAPAGDEHLVRAVRDGMLPRVSERFRERTGRNAFVYGNFEGAFGGERGRTRWESYPAEARFGTTYMGLRGRIGILVESYSYATFRDRVLGTMEFCRAILEDVRAHRAEIGSLLSETDERAERGGGDIALRSVMTSAPDPVTILGFEEEMVNGRSVSTGREFDYTNVQLCNRFEPTLTVEMPLAYAVTGECAAALAALDLHGIRTSTLAAPLEVEVEVYTIDSAQAAGRIFQKHATVRVEATPRRERRTIPAGATIVRTDQRLGRLAAYLLEPECEDGLTTWNFFDAALTPGSEFPVWRVVGDLP